MLKLSYLKALNNVVFKPLTMRQLPIHIQLEPTTYCNLDCKACKRIEHIQQANHLNLENFMSILKQIHLQKISFSGEGEPLMHPHLFEMIRQAKEFGCSINTTTNGTLLTPDVCTQLVESGLDLLKISIDAATPETYQQSRRKDYFLKVIEGIRRLSMAKQHLGSLRPFIRLNYVIFKRNYSEIAEAVKLSASLGIDAIYFQPLSLVGIEERYNELVGELTYDQLAEEIKRGFQMNQRYPAIKTNLSNLLQELALYWKKYTIQPFHNDPRICILPWFSAYITLRGNVYPCCSCFEQDSIMGNIFETPMTEIWNGTKYQHFRRAIRAGKRPFNICANCIPQTLGDILKISNILPGFLR